MERLPQKLLRMGPPCDPAAVEELNLDGEEEPDAFEDLTLEELARTRTAAQLIAALPPVHALAPLLRKVRDELAVQFELEEVRKKEQHERAATAKRAAPVRASGRFPPLIDVVAWNVVRVAQDARVAQGVAARFLRTVALRLQESIAPRWLDLSCHEHARYRGEYCGDPDFVRDEKEGVWVEQHRQRLERGRKLLRTSKRLQQQTHGCPTGNSTHGSPTHGSSKLSSLDGVYSWA